MKKINNKGFSLVELIVVIAILGVMTALVIPKMGASRDSASVNAAAREVLTNARYARDKAITDAKDCSITFIKDACTYTIIATPETTNFKLPDGVKISSEDFSANYKPEGTTGDPGHVTLTNGTNSKSIEFSTSLVRIK